MHANKGYVMLHLNYPYYVNLEKGKLSLHTLLNRFFLI
jgi:hypothetical protein